MTTTGPNIAGTGANDAAVGSVAWNTPTRVTANDASSTFFSAFSPGATSNYLKATNFGFAIASDQQIDGITVSIERDATVSDASKFVKDVTVKLVIGGTVSGSNLADTATKWPISVTVATYGGVSSLWGLTPTYSDINGSTFGVVLSAAVTNDSGKSPVLGEVDYISITITHSTAAAAGQPTSKRFGGVPFMGAHGAGIPSAVRQWMRRDSGILAPQPHLWRPAHGIN